MENVSGREPIAIVEIDQVFCDLVYGNSPCQAVLGGTGANKCFNTFKSCQDPDNFTPGTKTLRFVTPRSNLPKELGTLVPCLKDFSTASGTVRIDDGLGRRASVRIEMEDFPYHDRLVDKYASERVTGDAQSDGVGYNPEDRGTFWSKWIRRNPFYQGRPLRIKEGYVGQTLAQMRTRHYVMEQVDGPDSSGRVTITAKDILKLADGDRSQVPKPSNGRISADITESSTSATLSPSGIGNAEYPASGLARLGDELVDFTRFGDSLTLTRAVRSTEVDEHDADDVFQLCYTIDNANISDVMYDVITNYTTVDAARIPKADWDQEVEEWLSGFNLTGEITEPTGVDDFIKTVTRQTLTFMWWDEYAQEIKLEAIKPPPNAADSKTFTDDSHLLIDSVSVSRKPDERKSRVYLYYDIIDPTDDRDKPSNYRKLLGTIDTETESDNQFGEIRVEMIFAPYWDEKNNQAALSLATRKLARLSRTPENVEFVSDAKDRDTSLADVINIEHRNLVDLTGKVESRPYQVIKRDEKEAGHRVQYRVQNIEFIGRYAFVMLDSAPEYISATDDEQAEGGWISQDDDKMTNGDSAYKII